MKKFTEWLAEKDLVEVRVICNSCGAEGGCSNYDWNAGKARCKACGGSVEKKELAKPKDKPKENPKTN
jgi:hypothetical protein